MLDIYHPRTVDDLLNTLKDMNAKPSQYNTGKELVDAMKAAQAAELAGLREYLQTKPGSDLLTGAGAGMDMSDPSLKPVLAAGKTLPNTLKQCEKLRGDQKVHR